LTLRYVLLCRKQTPDPEDLNKILQAPGVRTLDHSVPRAVLVVASEEGARWLRSNLEGWTVTEEITYPPPRLPR
jgi:putative SOS response-associated peptidase YedK